MSDALESDNISSLVNATSQMKLNKKEELLKKIKNLENSYLKSDEVISILFLLYRNAKETFRDLEDFLNGKKSNLIYEWCIQGIDCDEMWESKFYESLFHIKNFKALKEFDIEKVNAVHTFNHKYLIPNIRARLYKVCENIYGYELKTLLMQMKESEVNVKYADYMEMYLLKWICDEKISLDNEVNVRILADSLRTIGRNNVADELFRYVSSTLSRVEDVSADEYPIIDHTNVGFCLIVNQKDFDQDPSNPKLILKKRNGTDFDASKLQEVFGKTFQFNVKVLHNVPGETMIRTISEMIENCFKPNHSVFVLAVLSHGSRDHVFGSDSKAVPITSIDHYCLQTPKLEGKPKVVIIQACQGDWFVKKDKPPAAQVNFDSSKIEQDGIMLMDWPTDTIFCMATIPFFATCRHIGKGSWYIIQLCEALVMYSNDDFMTILTRVSNTLNNSPVFNSEKYMKAIPEFKCRLTKKLFLKKSLN